VASPTLNRMRDKIRRREYVMTLHAEEEMDEDGLTIFDVESVILTGAMSDRQREPQTRARKYTVRGQTVTSNETAAVVTKFGPTGKLVIITVYAE
jgi:uncharacterized protein DUF4258